MSIQYILNYMTSCWKIILKYNGWIFQTTTENGLLLIYRLQYSMVNITQNTQYKYIILYVN